MINLSGICSSLPIICISTLSEVNISEELIGIIFSALSFGVFLSSLAIGKFQKKKGVKKLSLLFGIALQVGGNFLLMFTKLSKKEVSFLLLASVARFITGIGIGLTLTPCYSYLPLFYKSTIEEKVSNTEISNGLGQGLGSLLGGFIYGNKHYENPIITFICMTGVIIPLIILWVPYDTTEYQNTLKAQLEKKILEKEIVIKKKSNEQENGQSSLDEVSKELNINQIQYYDASVETRTKLIQNEQDQVFKLKSQLSNLEEGAQEEEISFDYCTMIKNKMIFLFYMMTVIPTLGIQFLDPTLGPFVQSFYHQSSTIVGIMFSLTSFTYIVLCPVGSRIIRNSKNIKFLLFCGCFFTGVSFLLIGPCQLLIDIIKHSIYFTYIANSLIGVCNVFLYIPVRLELVNVLNSKFPKHSTELNSDIAASLYSSAYAIGSCAGPLTSTLLLSFCKFPRASSILGLMDIGISLLFLFFGEVFTKKKPTTLDEKQIQEKFEAALKKLEKYHGKALIPISKVSYFSRGSSLIVDNDFFHKKEQQQQSSKIKFSKQNSSPELDLYFQAPTNN